MMKSFAQPFVKCIAAGTSLLRKRGGILLTVCLLHLALAGTAQAQARTILYVNKELAASGDGQAWGTAFKTLQEALDVTNADGATNYEIWVAEGAYYPDEGNGRSNNDRTQYFRINRDNVQIYGGFAGDETLRGQRNWAAHPVILSGDINGDGALSGNSFHVFYLNGRAGYGGAPITNATVLDGVTITGGNAELTYGNEMYGGGIYCDAYGTNNRCSPALANVMISGNYAESGGGMFNNGYTSGVSSPSLTDVIISGNRADRGGGMTNNGFNGTSSPSLTNVTISGNHATQYGGGMWNQGSSGASNPALVNSIVWGNTAPSGAQMYNYGNSTPQVSYSNVQGGVSGGTGNMDLDPLFADPVAASSAPSSGGDYRLAHGSPSIDTGGTNTGCPAVDVEGRTRPVDGDGSGGPVCDMGAYEYRLRFVDRDAVGPLYDGLSWTTAYTNVQAALDMTNGNYLTDYDIWVAEGTYYPDQGGNHVADSRTESFRIDSDNVQLYGGFAGDETARGQRNLAANPAVLSGDIDGDGALANNAYHVVYLDGRAILEGITAGAVLDGFTITGGNADGQSSETMSGGGIYCAGLGAGGICSALLANLVVSGNSAAFGGGIINSGAGGGVSRPALTNVLISGNSAQFGGGVFNDGSTGGASSPKLMGVTVAGNRATDGGGIYNNAQAGGASSPVIRNSIVWGNAATNGPQVYDSGSGATPQVTYSLVEGGGYTGDGNIEDDPLFVAPVAASSAPTATGNYRLLRTSPAIDAGTNTGCPPDDLDSGVRPRDGNADGTAICDMGAYESGLIFVGRDAPGPLYNGLSWTTAYTNVQDALDETNGNGLARFEVWVAQGTYYPDEGNSHADDDRTESFRINWDNVQLYGGFAATETLRTQRDWAAHPTVLSGEIDGVAGLDANAWHVVYFDGATNEGITAATVLDGFTITGGNANGDDVQTSGGGGVYCDATYGLCSPALTNLVISGNSASFGGGMYNLGGADGESSPVLTDVTISGNDATYSGGGMLNDGHPGESSPVLTNVIISGNRAGSGGGGMYNYGYEGISKPVLTNVTISGNYSDDGGALYNIGSASSPVLRNSIVWGNWSIPGTEIYNLADAAPQITYSNVQGDSVYTGTGNIKANPLFAAPVNASRAPTTTGDYRLLPGSPSIDSGTDTGAPDKDIRGLPRPVGLATDMGAYETQGFTLSVTGGDNQAAAVGATFGQSLTVQISSASSEPVGPGGVITLTPPNSGAGITVTVPFTVASDASGMVTTPVTANGVVGSYEVTATMRGAATPAVFSLTNTPISVTVALTGTGGGSVTSEPAGIDCGVTCTTTFDYSTPVTLTASADTGSTFGGWSGACSGAVVTCTVTMTETKAVTAAFTLNQYTIAVSAEPATGGSASGGGTVSHGNTVAVTATASAGYTFINWTESETEVSTSATYTFTAQGSRTLVANLRPNSPLHVDVDAPGPVYDGLSWTTAFTNVQDALYWANRYGTTDFEIWVAEGVYYPDEGSGHVDNSRSESFRIEWDNVQLFGGFAATETLRTQRNWTAHPTVLSGDIDGEGTLTGNAWHVVFLDGATNEDLTDATVLDGFTITGGNADATAALYDGGGVYCDGRGSGHQCSPTLAHLHIRGNHAEYRGGGLCNDGGAGASSPSLVGVVLSGNSADFGGGMYNNGAFGESSPALTEVSINGNTAASDGGGLFNNGHYGESRSVLAQVIISGNSAGNRGGGVYNDGRSGVSSAVLTNVLLSGNSAANGGGMFTNGDDGGVSSPLLTNVTISGNSASQNGGGLYIYGAAGTSSPQLLNSILWGNTAVSGAQFYTAGGSPAVTYSNVQDAFFGGLGNLSDDPLFAAPITGTLAPTTTGDYRLLPGSPSIDSGTDTDAPDKDIRGLPRPVGLATNMGPYEAQGFSLAISGGNNQSAAVGAAFSQPLAVQIESLGGEPVGPGGVITFTPPSSGAGLSVTVPFTAASDTGGVVTATVTANGVVGSYEVSAGMRGALDPLAFDLTNTSVSLSVTRTGTGSGSATSNPAGIDCGATCSAPFDYSTVVTLTASADTGSTFSGWSGACSGAGLCTVTMTETKAVTAAFTLNQYTVAVSAEPATGGTVSGSGAYTHSNAVTVTATANTGYTFTNWTEGGQPVSSSATYTFTATGDRTLVANFALNQYTVAVSAEPATGGTVSGSGVFTHGDTVTVTATANAGYTFVNWTAGGTEVSTSATYTFTATGDRTLVANFTLNQYTVAVSAEPTAGGTVIGGGAVNHGDAVTVTATANTGYTFVNWTAGGTEVSTSATYTFTATASRTLVANFSLNQYTVAISAEPTPGGTVIGGGAVNHGDAVTVTATANTGYTFANWTEGGQPVSSSATYTFTATGSRTLVANFTLKQYTVAVSAEPTAGGAVSGGGTVSHGDTVAVTATANTGYTFINWTEGGSQVSTSATYSFSATNNRTLVANFRPNSPLHVDADAPGPMHDGLSWTTAFTNVQDALYWTSRYGTVDYEVWVAEGVYYPDEGSGHVNNSRSESFRIEWDNVQIYGGFAATETLRMERNWAAHPTVLSGDIDSDETATGSAYHVVFLDGVTNEGITGATVLDGFTVTGGNGDGDDAPPNDRGGGLYCDGSNGHLCSPALTNLIFRSNGAYYGGGIYNNGSYGVSSPVLWNVTFSDNLAFLGGGVFNNGYYGVSSPSLTLVTVSDNAASDGGGMYNDGVFGASSPVLANVTISGNYADNAGGGMFNDGIYGVSSPVLTNVTVSGNQAGYGGAMYNKGSGGVSSPVLVNVIITGNRAGFDGGGMVNNGFFRGASSPVLTNVTLSGNSAAESGGGMYNFGRYFGTVNPVLTNSIVWGNEAITGTQFYDYEATPQITYSNVQGDSVYTGTGNLDADPLFAAPVAAGSAPVTAGDYRLLPGSPSIDSGTSTGAPPTDIRGLPRPVGLATDMGAYEAQGFSLSISGGNDQFAAVGAAFSQPLVVQIGSLGGEPVGPGGRLTFIPPASGPGLSVITPFTLATDPEGAAGTGATANGFAGSYNVVVAAGGVITPVAFALTNTPVFVTTAIAGTGSGTVTSEPAGIQCGSACTAGFDLGTVVTLTASAETGSTFGGWSGACSGTSACTVTMTETKAVTAAFTLNQYTVTVSAEPPAGGTVSGGGTVSHGDMVTVTASDSTGYIFTNWTEGGQPVSSRATYTFTTEGDRTLVANFTLLPQPLARNDAAGVLEGQAITIPVLANDLDPAGRGLAVIAVTQPAHGTASIDGSGTSVYYAATGGFHSEDSFDYTLEDGNGLTSMAKVVVVMAPLAHAEQAPQLAVIDPNVPNSTTFTSNVASVQVELPAGFYSGTVRAAGIFFLSYTAVVTPTQQTLTPPPALKFGNFQFFLSAYANELPLHGVPFAAPITLTIRYDPALLVEMNPETLQMLSWDGAGWSQDGITFVSHDIPNATLTVRLSHLSEFALFAAPQPTSLNPTPEPDGGLQHLYLPFVNNRALEPLEPPLAPAVPTAEPALPAGMSHIYLPAASR